MKSLRFFLLLVAAVIAAPFAIWAQVSVNTDGSAPHTSAMLDVKSTSKGLLIPRMSTAQRTTLGATATAGLMVYDSDLNKFYYHNGSGWLEGSVGGYWTRSGSTLFNTTSTDNIGIGTSTPGYVAGAARYFSIAGPTGGGAQTVSLELKGFSGSTFSPVAKIDFLSHGGSGTIYNIGRIESRITTAQYEGELLFYTNGGSLTEKMRIDELGNVGIGTTNPLVKLHVADGNDGAIRIGNHGNWYGELNYTYGPGDLVIQSGNLSTATGADIIFKTYGRNRAIVKGSGEVGIGTLVPLAKFHVHDSTLSNTTLMITPGTTVSGDSSKIFMGEDANGDFGMFWMYDGYNNDMKLFGKSLSTIYGPHLSIDRGTGNAAFGATFATGYKLSVSGKIICEELRVNLVASWPDYVFDKTYNLMPVDRLEDYIETNGHLPNVPAAGEIEKSGLDVGNMQKIMMEKIEELSLYIIEQQKQINELKEQVNDLKK